MAAGDATAAAAKFLAVAQSSPTPHQACLAAVNAALALLATGHAEDVSKAADLLRHHQLFDILDASLPYAERYAGKGHLASVFTWNRGLVCHSCLMLVDHGCAGAEWCSVCEAHFHHWLCFAAGVALSHH